MASRKPLSDPGWSNNFTTVPDISMSDIGPIVQKHSKVPSKHLDKGYNFFHGSYVHNIEVKVNKRGCHVRGKCYKSIKKNESPWSLQISLLNTKEIESQFCGCTAGKSSCAPVAALVYQLAHYKTLKMKSVPDAVSKTSAPQQWHVPPRTHGIVPRPLSAIKFVQPKPNTVEYSEQCLCSTLYNPLNTDFPDTDFMKGLQNLLSSSTNVQFLQSSLARQF